MTALCNLKRRTSYVERQTSNRSLITNHGHLQRAKGKAVGPSPSCHRHPCSPNARLMDNPRSAVLAGCLLWHLAGCQPWCYRVPHSSSFLYKRFFASLSAVEKQLLNVLIKTLVPKNSLFMIHPLGSIGNESPSRITGHTACQITSLLDSVTHSSCSTFDPTGPFRPLLSGT
jgi:hypothetical protein